MKLISWKVLLFSVPITFLVFALSSLFFVLVEIYCYKWFGAEKMDKADAFWKAISMVLPLSVTIGFKWSRGRSKVEKKPIVPWLLAVPMAILLTTGLTIVYGICYVAVDVATNYGLAEAVKLPDILVKEYWKTDQIFPIAVFSVANHPLLSIALFGTMLFGYYGPLDEDLAQFWKSIFENAS